MTIGADLTLKMAAGTPLSAPQLTEGDMPIEKTDYFQVTTEKKESKVVSIGELVQAIIAELPKPKTTKKGK
jgi:predicted transcriptional regulator